MLGKMITKSSQRRWRLLCTLLLIFHLLNFGVSAPTKHLKVTAEGDTPKLIVTSEEDEYGTEPKRLVAAKSKYYRRTTTLLSTISSLESTTMQPTTTTSAPTTSAPTTLQFHNIADITTEMVNFPKTTTTPNPGNKEVLKHTDITNAPTPTPNAMPTSTTTTTDSSADIIQIGNVANNMFHNGETTTISLLQAQPTLKPMMQSISSEQIHVRLSTGEENTTVLPLAPATTELNVEKMQTLEQKSTTTASNLVPPEAKHELLSTIELKEATSTAMELPAMTTTIATNIAVIDKLNDKMMISHKEKAGQTTKVLVDKSMYPMQFSSGTSTISVTSMNTKDVVMPTTDSKVGSDCNILTATTTTSTQIPIITTLNMDVMLNDEQKVELQTDGVLRLLDLEKQERKSQQRQRKEKLLKRKHQSQHGPDVVADDIDGHDGVKKTKKKQLQIDKHVLADIAMVTSSTMSNNTHFPKVDFSANVEKTMNKEKKSGPNEGAPLLRLTHTDDKLYPLKEDKHKFRTIAKIITLTTTTSLPKKIENIAITTTTENPTKATKKYLSEQTESKISDIQVEVYDSTVDSIVAPTNFKQQQVAEYDQPHDSTTSITKSPPAAEKQEKFTQYVIDRVESSTQESNLLPPIPGSIGKPEPAAIEIHINVSEGIGNASEDLEFSYPQTNFEGNEQGLKSYSKETLKLTDSKTNKVIDSTSSANTDEILVVEIIDTGENSTDSNTSGENIRPVFTFRTDQSVNEIEFKDNSKPSKSTHSDELFKPNVKHFGKLTSATATPDFVHRPVMDRDSDTIFYISNTEVKVGESLPTSNAETESFKSQQKSHLNSAYALSTHPNVQKSNALRFEEDILLSPLQNTADALKIFRSQNEADAPPLDVTYVGESVMEVEQLSPGEKEPNDMSLPLQQGFSSTQTPGHVIIQPATLSEIGVPVIGELPPQIELKEFDFMPDELTNHEQHSGGVSGAEEDSGHIDEEQTLVGNDVERLVESSIQYGGDLIDEGAVDNGGGFDGAEGSYPFGNLATMGRHGKQSSKRKQGAHLNVNHGVNNLRKDELSVDVSGASLVDDSSSIQLNSTFKDPETGMHNMTDVNMNITFPIAERMMNATTASAMENPKRQSLNVDEEYYWGMFSLTVSVIIAILPVVTIFGFICALR